MITKDRNFYKLIIAIALPIACQNLITFTVSMADSIMIGWVKVGAVADIPLTAVSLANLLFFIFMIMMFGIGSGGNILIAQYWGKGNVQAIHKIMSIMYKVSVLFAAVFMAIAAFYAKEFMGMFSQDQMVIELGSQYLKIVFISYVFFALTNATINALRAVKTVNISIVVYSVSLIVNVFLNWVLIFGNLGFPAMGVRGAAVATTIARLVEFIIAFGFLMFYEKKIQFKPRYLLQIDKLLFRDFVVVGGPVIANEFIWGAGSLTLTWIVSKMGTEVVAANAINNIVWQLVAIFIMGVGHAGAVIIGNVVGAAEYKKAQEYANTLIVLAVGLGVMGGMVMFSIRPYVLMLYKVSEITREIAMQILGISSGILLIQSLAFILMIGILRGGGDTTFVLITDVVFLWFVAIPLGYIAAVVLKLPLPVVYIILKCDELIKVVISLFRIRSGKWIKNVTRE